LVGEEGGWEELGDASDDDIAIVTVFTLCDEPLKVLVSNREWSLTRKATYLLLGVLLGAGRDNGDPLLLS
jgi:hypothetical protein